jgi:hypothetical protein
VSRAAPIPEDGRLNIRQMGAVSIPTTVEYVAVYSVNWTRLRNCVTRAKAAEESPTDWRLFCWGIAASGVFALIGLRAADSGAYAPWVYPTTICVTLSSLVCGFFAQAARSTNQAVLRVRVEEIDQELSLIEREAPDILVAIEQKARTSPDVAELTGDPAALG